MKLTIYLLAVLTGYIYSVWQLKKDNDKSKFLNIYYGVMAVAQIALAIVFGTVYTENEVTFILKRILLLIVLWTVAYTDYRSHRISNKVLLVGVAGWSVITLVELWMDLGINKQVLISECVYAGVILTALLLVRLITKGGIGMGDIKLMVLMGLLEGSNGLMGSIMLSCIVIFVIAVVLLVLRKKGRKDELPFAPAILLGSFISMILAGA